MLLVSVVDHDQTGVWAVRLRDVVQQASSYARDVEVFDVLFDRHHLVIVSVSATASCDAIYPAIGVGRLDGDGPGRDLFGDLSHGRLNISDYLALHLYGVHDFGLFASHDADSGFDHAGAFGTREILLLHLWQISDPVRKMSLYLLLRESGLHLPRLWPG